MALEPRWKASMLALRQNWKTILLVLVLIPPVWMGVVFMLMPFAFMSGPPVQLVGMKDLPETLKRAFEADPTLPTHFDVWQISGLPDRQCIWKIHGRSDYVGQFIQDERLEKTDSTHARAGMLFERMRSSWPKADVHSWEWYSTTKYGKEHLEGQDLYLVVTNSDRTIALVFYEWIF